MVLCVACVKSCAAAPRAMRFGEVQDFVRQADPPQGAGDEIAFPSCVRVRRKRLHRAAAATRKIAAERRDTIWAWGQNLGQCTPRTIDFGSDCLTGQGIGDKDQAIRALRDAFSALAKPVDCESGIEAGHPGLTVHRDWGITEHSAEDVREAKIRRTRVGVAQTHMPGEFSGAAKKQPGAVTIGQTSPKKRQCRHGPGPEGALILPL